MGESKVKQYVGITLDRERTFHYDLNALADLEAELGRSAIEVFTPGAKIGFRELRALLWAGLRHEDPELSVTAAGKLIGEAVGKSFLEKFNHVVSLAMRALTLAFGGEEEKKKAGTLEEEVLGLGTGETSSARPMAC